MLQNSGRVIKTDGWGELLRTCPEIANRIIASLSKYREESLEEGGSARRRAAGRDRDGDREARWVGFPFL